MLLESERNHGLGMPALVSVCSWKANAIMVWACLLWLAHTLGTPTESWFAMLLEHEWDYGLGMDALLSVCSWNTNRIMVWAWMLWLAYALMGFPPHLRKTPAYTRVGLYHGGI